MIHLLVFFGNTCELFDLKGLFVCFAIIMQKVMNILWVLFENAGINEIDKNIVTITKNILLNKFCHIMAFTNSTFTEFILVNISSKVRLLFFTF